MRVERDRVADGGMLFLAADSASWLTGVTLDVAGGYVMT
jgi:NAD(P)-dependent dehydrogenase (short-subunit alcohol dehydrogenase family)